MDTMCTGRITSSQKQKQNISSSRNKICGLDGNLKHKTSTLKNMKTSVLDHAPPPLMFFKDNIPPTPSDDQIGQKTPFSTFTCADPKSAKSSLT